MLAAKLSETARFAARYIKANQQCFPNEGLGFWILIILLRRRSELKAFSRFKDGSLERVELAS